MKNTIYTLLFSLSFLMLFTTCKNPGIDYSTFSITKENINPGKHSVMASGEYDFLGDVMSMKLNIGRDEQLADAESYVMDLDNQSFSVTVENLDPSILYYYCFVVEFDKNHKLLTGIGHFTTLSDTPEVRTIEATVVDSTTMRVKCIVDDDCGETITQRGVCWNLTGNPTFNDNHLAHQQNGVGEYSCIIGGLEYGKTYYVRAFARNANGVGYGEVLKFPPESSGLLPSVTTAEVKNITGTTATGGGTVLSEGSSPITKRGICWSTRHYPDINDFHAAHAQNGLGSYTVEMTNLTPNATYYVRAYAINEHGLVYGEEVNFIAVDGKPVVRIEEVVEETTGTTAICKCFIDDSGSSPITERGVCWSTEHHPTITSFHATDGIYGVGGFSVKMTNLTQNETYYVCAYAKNSDGHIGYSTEKVLVMKEVFKINVSAYPTAGGTVTGAGSYVSGTTCTVTATPNTGYRFQYWTIGNEIISESNYQFTVTSNVSLVAHFVNGPQPPVGAIDGKFTIDGNGNKVLFSQGNLQYNKSTQVWSFMEHQYDRVETANQDVGDNYANQNIISLFGWGTSGYHNSSDPYNENYQPWCTSIDRVNETYNTYGYGPSHNMSWEDNLTGSSAHYDWGAHNRITVNGSNTVNTWRTLTKDEWDYVFNSRNASTVNGVANARFTKARVNNVCGIVLFPDNYTHPTGVAQPTGINKGDLGWSSNNYNVTEFALMQAAGAVFLPAAGYRSETLVKNVNACCYYWSVTYRAINAAWEMESNIEFLKTNTHTRCDGLSVRLVCPVE